MENFKEYFINCININLEYYAKKILLMPLEERVKLQYVRFILLMRLDYVEFVTKLHFLSESKLRKLLCHTSTREDLLTMLKATPPLEK